MASKPKKNPAKVKAASQRYALTSLRALDRDVGQLEEVVAAIRENIKTAVESGVTQVKVDGSKRCERLLEGLFSLQGAVSRATTPKVTKAKIDAAKRSEAETEE